MREAKRERRDASKNGSMFSRISEEDIRYTHNRQLKNLKHAYIKYMFIDTIPIQKKKATIALMGPPRGGKSTILHTLKDVENWKKYEVYQEYTHEQFDISDPERSFLTQNKKTLCINWAGIKNVHVFDMIECSGPEFPSLTQSDEEDKLFIEEFIDQHVEKMKKNFFQIHKVIIPISKSAMKWGTRDFDMAVKIFEIFEGKIPVAVVITNIKSKEECLNVLRFIKTFDNLNKFNTSERFVPKGERDQLNELAIEKEFKFNLSQIDILFHGAHNKKISTSKEVLENSIKWYESLNKQLVVYMGKECESLKFDDMKFASTYRCQKLKNGLKQFRTNIDGLVGDMTESRKINMITSVAKILRFINTNTDYLDYEIVHNEYEKLVIKWMEQKNNIVNQDFYKRKVKQQFKSELENL